MHDKIDSDSNYTTHLKLVFKFSDSIFKNVPLGVKSITFNAPINNMLDHVSDMATKSIGDIPNSVTELIMGYGFDQPIDNLSKFITHLTLGDKFN